MAESVITTERFAKGKTYKEYVESGITNKNLFEMNYTDLKITPEQEAKLKALAAKPNGPHHMVVIGEDWCPDVYRGAPVAARIAETMGIEYRYFERDQNKDMIAEYLNKGEFESIPVIIFYDKDHNELYNLKERPDSVTAQLGVTRAVIGDNRPEAVAARLGHEPSDEELAAEREKGRQKYLDWQKTSAEWDSWRSLTVDEVITNLEKAVG